MDRIAYHSRLLIRIKLGTFLVVLSIITAVFTSLGRVGLPEAQPADKPFSASATPQGMNKIEHVVWIIQENHSFDNYFGTYPGADGIPPSTYLPVLPGSSECVKPLHMPPGQPLIDLDHSWATAHAAYDHGTMSGFVWAHGSPYTMGYYDERDIPSYWQYARHFTLCDRFFLQRAQAVHLTTFILSPPNPECLITSVPWKT